MKKRHFRENFYVRFYYKKNSELEKIAGVGPHYAGFQTREEAETHIEDCFSGPFATDTTKVQLLTNEEANS